MNEYSTLWFKTFLGSIPAEQTEKEVAFLTRFLPRPSYDEILDLCCGEGRHARLLATRGYSVTAIDNNAGAIERAQHAIQRARFLLGDMRALNGLHDDFDAVLCLWQSFGYFDDATNSNVLKQIADRLRPHGRFILDIYHRGFFDVHQEPRTISRDGRMVIERKSMRGNRLLVELDYGDGSMMECFEWQLYSPEEIRVLGARFGFACVLSCREFDDAKPPTDKNPRVQFVLEKK